jgi:hypothetical protein
MLCSNPLRAWSLMSCSIDRLLPSWNRMPRSGFSISARTSSNDVAPGEPVRRWSTRSRSSS